MKKKAEDRIKHSAESLKQNIARRKLSKAKEKKTNPVSEIQKIKDSN